MHFYSFYLIFCFACMGDITTKNVDNLICTTDNKMKAEKEETAKTIETKIVGMLNRIELNNVVN